MIRFYFHPTPNPFKVALFLEESGLKYEVVHVDTSKGEQHTPAFRAINPNGKVPAIVDTEGPSGREARVLIPALSCFISVTKSDASSVCLKIGRNCCLGCSSSGQVLVPSRARLCIFSIQRRKSFLMP